MLAWARLWSPLGDDAAREEAWATLGLSGRFADVRVDYWSLCLGPDAPAPLLLHAGIGCDGAATREALLRVALDGRNEFEFSRVDLDRPFPHYAVDTVRILKEKHPSDKLIYLMGGDSLRDLPTWHTPQEFVAVCDGIGVMHRPGDHIRMAGLEMTLPGITVKEASRSLITFFE